MIPALLHAVVRLADVQASDAELLNRFVHTRNEGAFEELVHRHGPLVWSVCRQLLANHTDAEDAFQAVFLAMVQGAARIRNADALSSWLHGVAIRAAEKIKRSAVRRRQREGRVALAESSQPIPDSNWASLMKAVHEEVQLLPDPERAAFILCELEGVRQPDAAQRLGCPLGTVSGRLCKARQRLIERLSRRGILPGMLVVGGLAGSAGVVPASLVAKVLSFPSVVAGGVSSTVASVAHGLVGGVTMRIKIFAATVLVASAMALTGGTMLLSNAEGQNGPGVPPGSRPSAASPYQAQPGPQVDPLPTSTPAVQGPTGAPALAGGGPNSDFGTPRGGQNASGLQQPGAMSGLFLATPQDKLEYRFVEVPLSLRDNFVQTINREATKGWEFISSQELHVENDGRDGHFPNKVLVLVFKKHQATEVRMSGGFGTPGGGGFGGAGMMGQGGAGGGVVGQGGFGVIGQGGPGPNGGGARPGAGPRGNSAGGPGGPGGAGGGGIAPVPGSPPPPTAPRAPMGINEGPGNRASNPFAPRSTENPQEATSVATSEELKVYTLKYGNAADLASVLSSVFTRQQMGRNQNRVELQVTPDPRTNRLIVRATPDILRDVEKLLKELDVPVKETPAPRAPVTPF